jgi:sugar transferase (PEP-CTERM system associated)
MRIRILGQYIHVSFAGLAALEALGTFLALIVAGYLRFRFDIATEHRLQGVLWPRGALFSAATFTSLLAFGLYSARQRARNGGIFVRVVVAVAVGMALTAFSFFVVPSLDIGRGVLSVAAIISIVLICTMRVVLPRVIDENLFKRRVLVYGCGQRATCIANLRRRTDRRGFVVVGYVPSDGDEPRVTSDNILDAKEKLLAICDELSVDEVVVAMDDRRKGFPIRELLDCRLDGLEVTELLTFLERETGMVRLDVLDLSWIIFGGGFRRGSLRIFSSRVLDLLTSLAILVTAAPVMLLVAIAIKLEDGWRAPVLYRQARVGLNNQPFEILKFRSMDLDAECDGKARWAQKSDPRVTCVGAIIRKLRIDELPQVVNVLRGHMSFVGPRPERPQFVSELAARIPYYLQRHCVKPGITGWAQLCYPYGSSVKDTVEKLQYDLYYIKNNSLLFDLAIILQTAEVVFMGKGGR